MSQHKVQFIHLLSGPFLQWLGLACKHSEQYGAMAMSGKGILQACLSAPHVLSIGVVEDGQMRAGGLWWGADNGLAIGCGPYVPEEHRRKGYGTAMREYAIEFFKSNGYRGIIGHLAKENTPSEESLKKIGTKTIGSIVMVEFDNVSV